MYQNLVAPSFLAQLSATIKQQPHAEALVLPEGVWSYEQLDQTINRLQFYLADAGLTRGAVVAIQVQSEAMAIVAAIAVLREGGAYLPLDTHSSAERLHYTMDNAGCRLILCDNDEVRLEGAKRIDIRALDMTLPIPKLACARLKPDSDAYIMYAAGTDKPKGVRMNHGTLNNLVYWQNQHYVEGECYRTLHYSALSCALSFQEVLCTLCQGGTLVIPPSEIKQDFRALLTFIDQQGVERLFLPFHALLQLMQWANRLEFYPEGVREWITSGEPLVISDELRRAFVGMPFARLINQYGSAESPVVTESILSEDPSSWPVLPSIGFPIENAEVWVLDASGLELGPLAEGELWVGGPVLCNGYINNEEETAKSFVLREINGEFFSAYRTGDLAHKNRYGEIFFKGRTDAQVRMGAYRIELAKIEAQLLATGSVRETAVAVDQDGDDARLIAFVVDSANPWTDAQHFAHLAQVLPDYMVPSVIIRCATLLKTPSGIVDRPGLLAQLHQTGVHTFAAKGLTAAALPQSDFSIEFEHKPVPETPEVKHPEVSTHSTYAQSPSDAELAASLQAEQVLAILRRELQQPGLSIEDNLAVLGFNSRTIGSVAVALLSETGLQLPAHALLHCRTARELLALLSDTRAVEARAQEDQLQGPIAIVGMAVRVPGAEDVLGFWRNLVAGYELIEFFYPTEHAAVDAQGVFARGVLPEPLAFDEEFFAIPAAVAQMMDPQQRLLLELSWQALENAGVLAEQIPGRIRIYYGTGENSYALQRIVRNPAAQAEYEALFANLGEEKDITALSIADALQINTPEFHYTDNRSTSLVTLCQAVEALRLGQCDLAVVGSSSLRFSEPLITEAAVEGIDSADGHTRPFDAAASGTVLSDGGAVVVLKRLNQARADGDHVYACIAGVGIDSEITEENNETDAAASLERKREVIAQALLNAGVSAESIGLVEAHATAYPEEDALEVAALTQAFRQHTPAVGFCHLGSLKSNFGHLSATAGLASLIKAALCVEQGARVASINFDVPNPALNLAASPFVVTQGFTPWPIPAAERFAGVSALGGDGSFAHVVLQGVDSELFDYEGPEYLPFCLSAKTPDALARLVATYGLYLEQNPDKNTHALAAYLLKHRASFAHRVSLGSNKAAQLSRAFQEAALDDTDFVAHNWVLAFPGQGSQILGMGLQLRHKVPVFDQALERCFNLLLAEGIDLAAVLWGDNPQALNQTHTTQLALYVIGYALTETLQSMGVPITCAIGHSIGELVAATWAGVFDLPTGLKVVAARGRLMQAQEPGAMLAVRRPASEVGQYLPEGAAIAAVNTADSCTLSGTFAAIDAAEVALKAAGIRSKRLETSHSFHSPSMDAAASQFASELSAVVLNAPVGRFISCVTGDWITPEQAQSIDYWASQLRQPVQFSQGLKALNEMPDLVVIEAGPGQSICGMVLSDLAHRSDVRRVPLLAQFGEQEVNGFSQALGLLWQYRVPLTWPHLSITPSSFTRLPPYPFARNQHEVKAQPLPVTVRLESVVVESSIAGEAEVEEAQIEAFQFGDAECVPESDVGLDPAADLALDTVSDPGLSSELVPELDIGSSPDIDREHDAVPVRELAQEADMGSDPETVTDIEPDTFAERTPDPALELMKNTLRLQMKAWLSEVSGLQLVDLHPQTRFSALGLSAVVLTQFVHKIAKTYCVLLNYSQVLNELDHPAALADYLIQHSEANLPQAAGAGQVQAVAADDSLVSLMQQQLMAVQQQLMAMQQQLKSLAGEMPTAVSSSSFCASSVTIQQQRSEISPHQTQQLAAITLAYNRQFAASKTFAQTHRPYLADAELTSSFQPDLKELAYPIVLARSEGAYVWDIDGSHLVDLSCDLGASFYGNNAAFIKTAIAQQLDAGFGTDTHHLLAGQAAALVCEVTANERAVFCNSASEAILGAVRLARVVTGRDKIVVFNHAYHSIGDEFTLVRNADGFTHPAAAGIPDATAQNVVVLDYGCDKALAYIAEHAEAIAAVLIEPVPRHNPQLQSKAFLHEARALCSAYRIALIFDEAITGFRIHPRGAQGYYAVTADLCTYSTTLGGGLPIGVISGTAHFMDALDGGHWQFGDDSIPQAGVTFFNGPFIGSPLALAAAVAVLNKINTEPHEQEWLNLRADNMVEQINRYAHLRGAPIQIANCGSICKVILAAQIPFSELIFVLLRKKGVHILAYRPMFISTAHSDDDITFIINAFKETIDEMAVLGFFPGVSAKITQSRIEDVAFDEGVVGAIKF